MSALDEAAEQISLGVAPDVAAARFHISEARRFDVAAREHRAAAAVMFLLMPRCPSCNRARAPMCPAVLCDCSESCSDLWHDVKGHRR